MSEKTSVTLDKPLVAEIRRAARRRDSAVTVGAILQEYAHLKSTAPRRKRARSGGPKFMTWADLAELGQIMREGGWSDPFARKPRRRRA